MQTFTQRLANPTRFMELSGRVLPWLAGAAAVIIGIGLYWSFFIAPPDYQQGETARIMFVHVPCAWLSMACYTLIAISASAALGSWTEIGAIWLGRSTIIFQLPWWSHLPRKISYAATIRPASCFRLAIRLPGKSRCRVNNRLSTVQ